MSNAWNIKRVFKTAKEAVAFQQKAIAQGYDAMVGITETGFYFVKLFNAVK